MQQNAQIIFIIFIDISTFYKNYKLMGICIRLSLHIFLANAIRNLTMSGNPLEKDTHRL